MKHALLVVAVVLACLACSAESEPATTDNAGDPVAGYRQGVLIATNQYASALDRISTMGTNPQPTSATWRQPYIDAAEALKRAGNAAALLEPPPCLQAGHDLFIEAGAKYTLAADALIEGLSNIDVAALNRANLAMIEGLPILNRATQALEAATC